MQRCSPSGVTPTCAHSLSLAHAPARPPARRSPTHWLAASLPHSLAFALARSHWHSLTDTLHTRSLARALAPSHSRSLARSHSLSLTHSLTFALTHSLTHSHSHSLPPSLPRSLTFAFTRPHSLTHSPPHTCTRTKSTHKHAEISTQAHLRAEVVREKALFRDAGGAAPPKAKADAWEGGEAQHHEQMIRADDKGQPESRERERERERERINSNSNNYSRQ